MRRLGKVLMSFAALVLINPVCLEGITPNVNDATPTEMLGPRTALLSPQAQEELNQLEDALKNAREKRDLRGEAQALRSIGLLNYVNDRFDDALEAFSSSLALYRELRAESLEATELCEMAAAYVGLGMEQKVLDAYKQVLPIWRGLDRKKEAATLGKIAEIFRMLQDAGEALRFDQAVLEAFIQTGDRSGQPAVLNNIEALSSFERELELTRKTKTEMRRL